MMSSLPILRENMIQLSKPLVDRSLILALTVPIISMQWIWLKDMVILATQLLINHNSLCLYLSSWIPIMVVFLQLTRVLLTVVLPMFTRMLSMVTIPLLLSIYIRSYWISQKPKQNHLQSNSNCSQMDR